MDHARALAFSASLWLLSGCGSAPEPSSKDIVIGLLLPYTGDAAATASNLERAALYARDRINAGGGVKGRRIRLVPRDTHSDLERGMQSAQELVREGAVVVLGPENTEIAEALKPWFAEQHVVFVSPLVGAGEPGGACATPWVRLAPSARAFGDALAKQVVAAGDKRVAIVYSSSAYDQALRRAFSERLSAGGGRVELQLELQPGAQGYTAEVVRAVDSGIDTILLATAPQAGALFVNEYYVLSRTTPHWFLSPPLKTEFFVQNAAPAALEGARGVSPKIFDRRAAFPDAFSKRWLGDTPLEGAYFYYDAMALVAIAMEKSPSEIASSDELSFELENAAVLAAASPPGELSGWNDIESALDRLRDHRNVYYAGLTGPLLLDECAARAGGVTSPFSLHAGKIVSE